MKKAFLLSPPKYSLHNTFKLMLSKICDEVIILNHRDYVSKSELKINSQIFRFPNSIREKWQSYYQQKINDCLLLEFSKHNPDIVFVYNNEMLLPDTLLQFKKTAKVIFFLGDSPFYTPTNNYFLTLLYMGDLVLAPDSFWVNHMKMLGIKNVYLFFPGIDSSSYNQEPQLDLLLKVKDTDVIYCGMSYIDSWGFKKALLMDKFTGFNLEIYGNKHWRRWFEFFPKLKSVFQEKGFIPTPLLNAMFNKAKLMAVDGNPGILNGMHNRLFESLGSGVLPLIENRKDVTDTIFKELDIEIPVMYSYNDAITLAEKYLSDENLRLKTVSAMKQHILEKYNAEANAKRLLNFLHLN
jgi:spore maturation protein CgeB